ncbi:glycosyl hydrolase [Colletotrichum scovillei]|uniref:Glycosyl hydrolase n=1 Tax=Colletotrichum scovillei TaxID=1209932 RepID=A0A9P7RBN3_9PEZI|nr:glycosyl hydrolase [Colletotrichum scovillei]KAF4775924.1 glycosyl hydrolase [Colletotrichum scovillei]KAG7053653.1 glycosyl hydrolase [Colletotrichum scovillei]KAG7071949.1 glycosyl hydrolase [Colletotrichum scovillei]KAG7080290.1 glycosyl hydrolase [Colletotrichum scovillei]
MSPNLQTAAIPAATVQSHASNLLQLPDKTLLCAWFGGSQEGLPDISIWLSRQEPGTTSWSTPQKISSDTNRSCQNPVLFRAPKTGDIWLFHTSQDAGNQDGAIVMARTSSDNGKTWSSPRYPLKGVTGAFVRQPLVVLGDDTWVLPVFHCRSTPGQRWIGNNDISAVFYSKDEGQTWIENVVPDSIGSVHMNIIAPKSQGSEYVAFFRSRWADNVYRSTSPDGLNWAAPKPTSLPNPNSGICAARLASGNLAIVFNRSSAEPDMAKREGLYDDITPEDDKRPNQASVNGKNAIWGTPRKTLTVAVSGDDGLTWKEKVLEEGDGFCMTNNSIEKTNRELSYPSIFVEKGSVHVAFTFHRQYIKYVRISDIEGWVDQA